MLDVLASAWNKNGSVFAGLAAVMDDYDDLLGAARCRPLLRDPARARPRRALAARRPGLPSSASMPTASPIFFVS